MDIKNKIICKAISIISVLLLICIAIVSCNSPKNNKELSFIISDDGTYYTVIGIGDYASSKTITIPGEYNELPVKVICERAFSNTSIKKVIIGDGIEIIEEGAFSNCDELRTVEFGNTVKELGDQVFYECDNLKEITIPDSIVTMGQEVFKDCKRLVNVTLSLKFYDINWSIFMGCDKLKYREYAGCKYLGSKGNPYAVLMQFDKQSYNGDFKIHQDAKIIANNALSHLDMTDEGKPIQVIPSEYHVPNGIISIGTGNFTYAEELETLYIPESVRYIGPGSFGACPLIDEIVMETKEITIDKNAFNYFGKYSSISSIYFIGSSYEWDAGVVIDGTYNPFSDDTQVFYYSENLPTERGSYWHYENSRPVVWVDMLGEGSNLEYILSDNGEYYSVSIKGYSAYLLIPAFYNGLPVLTITTDKIKETYALTTLIIEEGITTIGYGCFSGCTNLKTVKLPSTLTSIGESAFANTSIEGETLVIDKVTSIGKAAFDSCKFDEVVIGAGVTENLIDGLAGLRATKFTISDDNPNYTSYQGDIYDKNKETLLKVCEKYNLLYKPIASVKNIGEGAFKDSNVKYLVVGEGIDDVPPSALAGSAIDGVVIPLGKEICMASWEYVPPIYLMCSFKEWEEAKKAYNGSVYTTYFYSEERPYYLSKFWHYDHRNLPTLWD